MCCLLAHNPILLPRFSIQPDFPTHSSSHPHILQFPNYSLHLLSLSPKFTENVISQHQSWQELLSDSLWLWPCLSHSMQSVSALLAYFLFTSQSNPLPGFLFQFQCLALPHTAWLLDSDTRRSMFIPVPFPTPKPPFPASSSSLSQLLLHCVSSWRFTNQLPFLITLP